MSTSSAAAGDDDGCCCRCTTTTVSPETVTGSHVFVVQGYSKSKGALGVGRCVYSGTFAVGGHSWCIGYYPDSARQEHAEYISFCLHADRNMAVEEVTARYAFSLLDHAGQTVAQHRRSSGTWKTFSGTDCAACRGVHLMTRDELESSPHLQNDSFRIQCDVIVFKDLRQEVPPSEAHRRRQKQLSDGGGTTTTTTTITTETVTGSHVLVIEGYSKTKGVRGVGTGSSGCFTVGGYDWCVMYFLDGYNKDSQDFIGFFLKFDPAVMVDVNARFKFSLLDCAGEPLLPFTMESDMSKFEGARRRSWGFPCFLSRVELEDSPYLRDDSFKIRCDVIISMDSTRSTTMEIPAFPPSDLGHHIGNLLASQVGADVVFEVGGETCTAHRNVLAARSPVFIAELYGSMRERAGHVQVSDVEPEVFRAFLHFIYTYMVPEVEEGETVAMAQHLLVVADTYRMDRLKLVCECVLCTHIEVNTVATTLALAEQHGCCWLKEACFKFMASPRNFKGVMESDGFEHLVRSCPYLLKELAANIAA